MERSHKVSTSSSQENSHNQNFLRGGGDVALYVHLPFCVKRCKYCDFNSYAYTDQNINSYLEAVLSEARLRASNLQPQTVFIGGGTPTFIEAEKLRDFLLELSCITNFRSSAQEVTVEANPESFDENMARALLDAGVNRLSIGFQSLHDEVLKAYDRVHDAATSFKAFEIARNAGFDNINIDLIYSFPGQNPEQWGADLEKIHRLAPEHLSCYELSYEPGTALTKLRDVGGHQENNDEFNTLMFELTRRINSGAGYQAYEVSAFALDGRQCEHNLIYWNSSSYVGIGAGAASWVTPYRTMNLKDPDKYIAAIVNNENHFVENNCCDNTTILFDCLMMGLRLEQCGVSVEQIENLSKLNPLEHYKKQIGFFVDSGLLEIYRGDSQTYLRATASGILQLDTILGELLPDSGSMRV